jgi:(2Fe-2S) ferredoxin
MKNQKHIFICINERDPDSPKGSCGHCGGWDIRMEFVQLINKHGLKGKVRANKAGCLDACELGPALVVYPSGYWYTGVKKDDVETIFKHSILKDDPVEKLIADESTWDELKNIRSK